MKTTNQSTQQVYHFANGVHPGATAVMAAVARSFPDEYKQTLWEASDKRFLSIVAATFLVSYSLFGTFLSVYKPELTTADYNEYLKSLTSPVEIRIPEISKPKEEPSVVLNLNLAREKKQTQNQASKSIEQRLEEKTVQLADVTKDYQADLANKTAQKLAEIARISAPKTARNVDATAANLVSINTTAVDFSKPVKPVNNLPLNSRLDNNARVQDSNTEVNGISSMKTSHGPSLSKVGSGGTIQPSEFRKLNPGLTESGNRSGEALAKTIEGYTRSVQGCYESHKIKDPALNGSIEFELVISPEGKVTRTSILNSSLKNDEVGRCIMNRMRTWSFGASSNGKSQTIKIPYVFSD